MWPAFDCVTHMPPRKQPTGRRSISTPTTPRELGLRAFQNGRLDAAIGHWAPLVASDPAVARAFVEALLRRAMSVVAATPEDDLRRAAVLAPADPRPPFHLGRRLHHDGRLAEAAEQYRRVIAIDPANFAAARLLALATLQQDHAADLAGLPGMTPAIRAWAAPAQALLLGQQPPDDGDPVGTFWRGLALLSRHDPAALTALSDERPLPGRAIFAHRAYHRGAAEALSGNIGAAIERWGQLFEAGQATPPLAQNLAALLTVRLSSLMAAGKADAAGELAWRWFMLPGAPAFDELRVQALDQTARAAAAAGDWARAADRWDAARQVLARAQGLGSPRPILHNLALAFERQERWEEAADAWRALLRTRRRGADEGDEARRWSWVRARVIECYRHAGRPDEAVTVFRQALKVDPNDLELRLQLADALYANEQERAAYNEIQRILQIDPHYPEAVLRQADYLTSRYQFAEALALVRDLAERNPGRSDLRARVGQIFLDHGRAYSNYGDYKAAYSTFVEGERYGPNEPRFALNQARMLSFMHQPGDTAALIERALAVGGEQHETWVLAIETWLMVDDLEAARALIARYERERSPGLDDYLALGFQLLSAALPPPPPAFFARVAPPPPPKDTPWTRLALEQLERGVALRPDDRRPLLAIASFLMLPRPDLAVGFAARAVALAPDDPEVLIVQGVALGLAGQVSEARATLQRATQVARQQGRHDLREQAQELRRVVGTPALRLMLSSALHGDDELDDPDDFFFG